MLNDRQSELLKLIVENYIKTAKPVSSNALCDMLNCSSATIRNEMVYLEDVGLIEKTHISSGRVPSEKGYRYYVDKIMKPKELLAFYHYLMKSSVKKLSNYLLVTEYLKK